MRRTSVKSSLIKSVGYSQTTHTLEIRYEDSTVFQYFQVPSDVALRLQKGKNIGSWWVERWNDFQYKQIT
jgi:KTSC domain-containing protein